MAGCTGQGGARGKGVHEVVEKGGGTFARAILVRMMVLG